VCCTYLPCGLVPQAHSRTPAGHDAEAHTALHWRAPHGSDRPSRCLRPGAAKAMARLQLSPAGVHTWPALAPWLGRRRAPGSPRHPGARGRPRAVMRTVRGYGSRRSARRRAHYVVGRRTIPAHTQVARRTDSAQGRPWRAVSTTPWAGRAHRRPLMPSVPASHTAASSRAGHSPWRRSACARVPCARPRHQHYARASAGSCSVPVRGTSDEHTPAEHHHQRHGLVTRVLAGATRGGGGQAPAGPGTPAAVAPSRAPHRICAQWWTGSRISSGPSSG
jgi:hypothetical protein